jgi:hypothetical protein
MATSKPLRSIEGSFFNRTGRAAKYMNSIRVQNLPKTIDVFNKLKEYIMENEDMFGPVLSIRVRRECKKGAKEDMVVFIRLHQSEKHVQLLSCLDGEHEQGVQVKATNSNFTNEPHNDDFRSGTTCTGSNTSSIQCGSTIHGRGLTNNTVPIHIATKMHGATIQCTRRG